MRLLTARARGEDVDAASAAAFSAALRSFVEREGLSDLAFSALVLNLPAEADIAQEIGTDVDPDAIHEARMDFGGESGRIARGRCAGCTTNLRRTDSTVPTRRVPAAAPCAMSPSISWPDRMHNLARASPWGSSRRPPI